jgi:hypothetical protein
LKHASESEVIVTLSIATVVATGRDTEVDPLVAVSVKRYGPGYVGVPAIAYVWLRGVKLPSSPSGRNPSVTLMFVIERSRKYVFAEYVHVDTGTPTRTDDGTLELIRSVSPNRKVMILEDAGLRAGSGAVRTADTVREYEIVFVSAND